MATLMNFLGSLVSQRKKRMTPTKWMGAPGFAVYGGYISSKERNAKLDDYFARNRTYSDILANTSIVAASVRYYLNLICKSEWSFDPSEADTSGEFAERLEKILIDDMMTPWHRVVRRAAMYRFYGFSVQEWRAMRNEEGWIGYADVRPRPQSTIEKWDTDLESGDVIGIVQRRPQDSEYLYVPREKLLYMTDDAISDSPIGLGILRHMVDPAERLLRYEQLEGFGFEVDLRNVPVGKAPLAEIYEAVASGDITETQANALVAGIKDFVSNHAANPALGSRGLVVDSSVYTSRDDREYPSTSQKYDMQLLSGDQSGLSDVAAAIERVNREMARIMGTEQLLLGAHTGGSYALSQDKTGQFYLMIDSTLMEVQEMIERDLIDRLWMLNGWADEMKPVVNTEAVRLRDVEQIATTLRDLAQAGAMLAPNDPIVSQVRDLMGVERPPDEMTMDMNSMMDAMMGENMDENMDDDEEMSAMETPVGEMIGRSNSGMGGMNPMQGMEPNRGMNGSRRRGMQ